MRRRDSRGHYKAYQALLEAFIASTRRGDSELSTSLYRTIELTDTSGKLAEVAQCFVQVRNGGSATSSDHSLVSIDGQLGATFSEPDSMETLTDTTSIPNDAAMARSPFPIVAYDCDEESSAPAFTPSWAGTRAALPSPGFQSSCVSQRSGYQSSNLNDTPPKGRFVHLSSTACTSEDQSLQTYEQLLAFWDALRKTQPVFHLQEINVGSVAYDTKLTAINDNFSNMIAEFRYGARHAIRSGTSLQDVLGTCVPSLGAYFYPDANKPILSAWDFACNFCATIPGLPVDLQLTMIYLVGLQMRFLIHPSREMFYDLPPMLRPLRKQYTVSHPAAVDLCHFLILRHFLLDHWQQYHSLLMESICRQDCNWPYSNAACFGISDRVVVTLSAAFIEHISKPENYTIEATIVERMASWINRVRS